MYKKVNEIYGQILSNHVSIEKGSKEIIECIFLAPAKFGLHFMKPDQQSEFILFLLVNMPHYIKNYSISRAQFSTYLTSIIINMKKTWYRQYYRKSAQEQSIQYYCTNEELILEDSANATQYCGSYDKKEFREDSACHKQSYPLRLLILALKACYYLTPEHIRILAKKTGYSEDTIYHYKYNLEQLMQKKIERHTINEHKVNSAFIKKNRCLIELMNLHPETSLAHRVRKSYAYYAYLWNRKVKKYTEAPHVRPTNSDIGQVLHIKQHQVYQALRQIKKENEKYTDA